MVELQAAERRELSRVIPELPAELPGPRIGSAYVGMAVDLGRGQGGAERHLQIQLPLRPLTRIG